MEWDKNIKLVFKKSNYQIGYAYLKLKGIPNYFLFTVDNGNFAFIVI